MYLKECESVCVRAHAVHSSHGLEGKRFGSMAQTAKSESLQVYQQPTPVKGLAT